METILGIARHLLTAGGTYLVTKGYLDMENAETIVGAILTIANAIWFSMAKSSKFPKVK